MGVAPCGNVVFSLTCLFALLTSLSPLRQSSYTTSTSTGTMKVTPVEQNGIPKNKMKICSKVDQHFLFGIHTLARCLGMSPYKMDKETGELSFRWISCETIWSLTRLIVTNAPFSFLPIVLFACFGAEEWNPEEMSRQANMTSGHWSESPIILGVFGVEIISGYSYFILFRAAKK